MASFICASQLIYKENGIRALGVINQGGVKASCLVRWKVWVPILQKVFEENIAGLLCQDTARTNRAKTGRYLDTCIAVGCLNNLPPQQKRKKKKKRREKKEHKGITR